MNDTGNSGSRAVVDDLQGIFSQTTESPPGVEACARALRVSVRTLQRRLQAAETSFEREVAVFRVRHAQRLMRETDASLSRIASDVGFTSLARLSVVFRRVEGTTPSQWRKPQKTGV
jgi:transcriptional regulator GlxA family with amidase domain